jgi:hypothetical protein
MIVVLNPNSGVGSSKNKDYMNAFHSIVLAGYTPVGYISTRYANRDISSVKAEIDTYAEWYGAKGFFFDEMSTTNPNYYSQLTLYAKSRWGSSTLSITNPGTTGSDLSVSDITVISESSSYNSNTIINKNEAVLVYALPSIPTTLPSGSGWFFCTNGTLPNPWGILPSYWSQLVIAAGTTSTSTSLLL